jgi:hypothetical protein
MATAYNEPKYQIELSEFRCSACSEEMPCEAAYYSVVSFDTEGFRRKDFCLGCWKQPAPDGSTIFAFWRTRRPPQPSARPKRLRFDSAVIFEFFQRLDPEREAETGTREAALPSRAEREELRFVISLLLLRNKVLNFESSKSQDGVEWLKLSEKKDTRRFHWVRNPELADSQLERVKDRIGDLLQMQL